MIGQPAMHVLVDRSLAAAHKLLLGSTAEHTSLSLHKLPFSAMQTLLRIQ
jgi:hypothetical protein